MNPWHGKSVCNFQLEVASYTKQTHRSLEEVVGANDAESHDIRNFHRFSAVAFPGTWQALSGYRRSVQSCLCIEAVLIGCAIAVDDFAESAQFVATNHGSSREAHGM